MIFEKSCGAIVYTVENGVIKYLLVEEMSNSDNPKNGADFQKLVQKYYRMNNHLLGKV